MEVIVSQHQQANTENIIKMLIGLYQDGRMDTAACVWYRAKHRITRMSEGIIGCNPISAS